MIVRRCAYLIVVAALMAAPSASAASECGSTDPKTHRTVRGTLRLDEDSVTSKSFQADTDPQKLLLRFKVSGCELPPDPPPPETALLAKTGMKDIPDGAIRLVRAVADGSEYSLRLTADPNQFDPGSYGAVYELRAPTIIPTRTPIELSRSESNVLLPLGIGVVGGLAGIFWFLMLNFAKGAKTRITPWHYGIVFAAAAIAGALAVYGAYRSQDVWSFSANSVSAFAAAFTGATTGAMATALAVLWPEPSNGDAGASPGEGAGSPAASRPGGSRGARRSPSRGLRRQPRSKDR
jgi:hypothetical protein